MRRNDIFRAMDDVFQIILSSHRLFFGVGNTLCPFHLSSLRDNNYSLLREAYSAHFSIIMCLESQYNI